MMAALTTLGIVAPCRVAAQFDTIEVLVTAGPVPQAGVSVALDLNNNGVWEEHLGEPREWTGVDGVAVFSSVVSIEAPEPDSGGAIGAGEQHPARILVGNLRGAVGAQEVRIDFVLPSDASTASLGLFDLRGRRLAHVQGIGDLALEAPGDLPTGVYFLRLSADLAAPVSRRFTSVGTRTRSVIARRVSMADATAAGWIAAVAGGHGKDAGQALPINLIVEHDGYPAVIQPVVVEHGQNSFVVDVGPTAPAGFVYLPPGMFMMGSPWWEPGRMSWEAQHQVTLTEGFFISTYEVIVWNQMPRIYVSWDEAVAACNLRSLQEGLTPAYTIHGPMGDVTWDRSANGYRLPTEAEWEYACRAGSQSAVFNGEVYYTECEPLDSVLDVSAWYCGNAGSSLHAVGLKQPNAWGLYDMHGNAQEWVWCAWRNFTTTPQVDPVTDGEPGVMRMVRGGYYSAYARFCRSASRNARYPDDSWPYLGSRMVRSAP